jgi:nucleoside-diphosphate-sugar epimerase
MRYFVTGATGFIGGRVARQLVEAGHTVVTLARRPEQAGELATLGIEVRKGDITEKVTLREPMGGVDGVFHIAGWYKIGLRDRTPGWRINVDGTRNVLETMRDLGIPKGVYTSTLAVFSDTHGRVPDETYRYTGPHLSEYDRTKWAAHYRVAEPMMQAGLPLVIVQPGLTYGPGDTSQVHTTFVEYLRRRLPIIPRKTAFCWSHVDDAARGHILAMEKGQTGQSYIIAGPPHTLAEALSLAERITGIPAPRLQAPPFLFSSMAAAAGLVERFATLPESYSAEGLRIIAGVTYLGSNAKARRELGFAPRPLEEGLREYLEYERAHLGR